MGIRIHKVLGYGLVDVSHNEDFQINDERFNPKGIMNDIEEFYFSENKENFIAFLEEKKKEGCDVDLELNHLKQKDCNWDFYDSFTYDGEFGDPKVFCITPVTTPNWKRYDDIIDYYIDDCQESHYKILPYGIYPWQGFYFNKRTNKPFYGEQLELCRYINFTTSETSKENILKKLGIESKDDIRPMIPNPVIHLCEYFQVFNDINVVYELKPILYTYWR